jgi:hypothetical protein
MDANNSEITVGTYFMEWWRSLPDASRHKWLLGLGLAVAIWLVGAALAPGTAAGIGALSGIVRLGSALAFGGFSFLWLLLEAGGYISESAAEPSLFWLPLAAVMPGLVGLFLCILSRPPNPIYGLQKLLEKAAANQGRVEAEKIADSLAIEQGIPLVQVEGKGKKGPKRLLGLDYERLEGHVLVTAATRAGKGLHLTETLLCYPGPAFVLDPKSEQYERTAAWRRQWGPVYRVPGHQVHLSAYYRHLRDRDDAYELHYHLLRPWQSRESIFAEKSLSLFYAVGAFARAHKLNAIRLLLDLAESNPQEALAALRTVPEARRHVDIFTNGASPQEYHHDRFVTSALGNFTARLAPYQAHIDTIAPPDLKQRDKILPPDWANQNGTVYLTYSLNDLRAAGGVVAAIVAAILRYQVRQGSRGAESRAASKLLLAIDELPAVGLRNISDYLATVGGYGVTLLLYVQSVAQLQELYGQQGTRAILSNCVHQVWYPAAEMETAKLMSELYGTTLKASPVQSATQGSRQQQGKDGQAYTQTSHNQGASWAWREGAALTPNEMMALPQGQVLVATQQERRQVFLGERLDPIPLFDRLPGPNGLGIPRPLVRERTYTDWTALAAALVGGGKSATNTPRQTRDQAQPEAPPVVKADDEEAGANGSPVTQKLPAAKTQPAQTEPAATLLVDEETDKKMF